MNISFLIYVEQIIFP